MLKQMTGFDIEKIPVGKAVKVVSDYNVRYGLIASVNTLSIEIIYVQADSNLAGNKRIVTDFFTPAMLLSKEVEITLLE